MLKDPIVYENGDFVLVQNKKELEAQVFTGTVCIVMGVCKSLEQGKRFIDRCQMNEKAVKKHYSLLN